MHKICLFLLLSACSVAVDAADPISFNKDIRPILSDKCFHCHGPDASERQADLRLDTEESAKQDREGYAAITPGNVEKSELVSRILTEDPDLVMPPADSGRTLTAEEKQTLIQWIKDGAVWEGHWSFSVPERPALPTVQNSAWPRNGIDYFVLHRLEQKGLRPAAAADRETWIRRVTFDLTGLPPTPAEIDAFLADESEAAFETVVDRLLDSERYGEHMAAMWLDAARYADTDGYQNDGPRTMFRWRDWVIDAYNANMSFRQFTIEQLAGDLLPDATTAQKIATGFNRNHRYNSEAGLVQEEFLLENAVDRVDTTATVWMGLTMGCARCHDHKYDPFTQREYYQLISFFDNITESGRAIKFGNSEPWLVAPTDDQQKQLDQLDDELQQLQAELKKRQAELDARIAELESVLENADIAYGTGAANPVVSRGLKHHLSFEDMKAEKIKVEKGGPVLRDGLFGKAATVGGNGVLALGQIGDIACQTRSSVSFWLKPEELKNGVILSRQQANTRRPGFTVEIRDGHLQFYIITRWIAGVGAVETKEKLEQDKWVHVVLTNDGSQRAKGQQIWIDGRLVPTKILHNTNSNTGGTGKSSVLRFGGGVHGSRFKGQMDELRIYNRTLFDDEIALLAERRTVLEILSLTAAERTDVQTKKLIALLRYAAAGDTDAGTDMDDVFALMDRIDALRDRRVKLLDSFPTTMVMEERPDKQPTPIRVRGVYHNHGDPVSSDTPSVFPAMPEGDRPERLKFAEWLVSGRHPLTARVTVNRYWQQYFGFGLVKTPEDFGLQGELPSHPQLLDWLAAEFVESGWDVKAMQKLIVLSSVYRQSSRHVRHKGVSDPENRLLARGPRVRLTARQLRDQALFVSGLLTPDIGGPSVSPYQPARLWAEMSNMKYRQSKGKDLYRRGIYTIWKRTVAPPGLAILDAADRESCSVRPKRTNTPLQALTLLNETTFVEAARHLAVRMTKDGKDRPIEFVFRLVMSRYPTEVERQTLADARQEYLADFQADEERAAQLLAVGESPVPKDVDKVQLAADTLLCNVILNLDEAVTKE